ncbi:hypothetical protein QO002_004372 [Pararhizobium capsulatum DSM 1112]|uniref:Uncharacterized protein n=1 Tax=Pararhizobium capsulatum DSM 1112 TaxID=1121113 RepID=A0ABU0BV87_9HYPH|nr:hypothetical protein [Pararhizobium capsulatum DSM 1112]
MAILRQTLNERRAIAERAGNFNHQIRPERAVLPARHRGVRCLLAGFLFRRREETFPLHLLAGILPLATNRFSLLACSFHGWLLEGFAHAHFAKNSFALKLLFQNAKRLIDVIVANQYLHF